jgi:hypothetical protein
MKPRRLAAPCCFIVLLQVVAQACALLPAHGQTAADTAMLDESLKIYSAGIVKTRLLARSTGVGIYLGRGAVVTAAHVIGRWHFLKDLQVRIAGQELPAKIVKEGSLEDTDLTVLSVDEERLPVGLRLRRNPLCKDPMRIGREVVVVAGEATARSRIIPPQLIPAQYRAKFGTIIADVAMAGSGSGVFDAGQRCLLGIVSRRISRIDAKRIDQTEFAKYFVPASTMADFLPDEYRF